MTRRCAPARGWMLVALLLLVPCSGCTWLLPVSHYQDMRRQILEAPAPPPSEHQQLELVLAERVIALTAADTVVQSLPQQPELGSEVALPLATSLSTSVGLEMGAPDIGAADGCTSCLRARLPFTGLARASFSAERTEAEPFVALYEVDMAGVSALDLQLAIERIDGRSMLSGTLIGTPNVTAEVSPRGEDVQPPLLQGELLSLVSSSFASVRPFMLMDLGVVEDLAPSVFVTAGEVRYRPEGRPEMAIGLQTNVPTPDGGGLPVAARSIDEHDWGLFLSGDALGAILRRTVAQEDSPLTGAPPDRPERMVRAEILDVEFFSNETIGVSVRVWVLLGNRGCFYRDVWLQAGLRLGEDGVVVRVRSIADRGGSAHDPLGLSRLLLRPRSLDRIAAGLELTFPRVLESALPWPSSLHARVRLEELYMDQGVLAVFGSAEIGPKPDAQDSAD